MRERLPSKDIIIFKPFETKYKKIPFQTSVTEVSTSSRFLSCKIL